ncbi:MAG: hypothetical protein U0U70_09155 [Chitinophagaceae bacterium]
MKKLLLSLSFIVAFSALHAQTDSLQEYTGKYKFPDGSPVAEIGVVLENGVLTATSVMGNSELKKTDNKDVFEIVAYAGTATFRRTEEGKVKGMRVQVQDVDMEGTKSEGAWSFYGYQELLRSQY